MKKSELRSMIKEVLKEELSRKALKESTNPYTIKDFTWLSDAYYADKFKLAALAYLNGADIDSALADIKNELMAAGDLGKRKTGLSVDMSTGEGEYSVIYRLASWPSNKTETYYLDADSKEEAEDLFFHYMLDPDSYDEGETLLDESDIQVLHIFKRPN